MPLQQYDQPDEKTEIRKVLFGQARKIVKDENWEVNATQNGSVENQQQVREWNRSFLSATEYDILP